jgi:hypothetical protein
MRCVLRPVTRADWSPLLVVLVLAVLPTDAFAQSLVCQPIRRGESATQAARRVTGNGRNVYQAWFQIMNPASRFIPKSQYNRIRAGWRACVIKSAAPGTASNAHLTASDLPETPDASEAQEASGVPDARATPTPLATIGVVEGAGDRAQSAASDVLRMIASLDLTMVWLGAALVVPWFGWRIVDDYLARRKTASIVVRHFAVRFVDEFERPLVRYHIGERPVRSYLRRGARRGRFDILLAPGEGRRYPNLSDHKKNVEYDVARVMHVLADDSFVSGPPYTHAGWIVVPFRFTAGPKQSGVSCISSF